MRSDIRKKLLKHASEIPLHGTSAMGAMRKATPAPIITTHLDQPKRVQTAKRTSGPPSKKRAKSTTVSSATVSSSQPAVITSSPLPLVVSTVSACPPSPTIAAVPTPPASIASSSASTIIYKRPTNADVSNMFRALKDLPAKRKTRRGGKGSKARREERLGLGPKL